MQPRAPGHAGIAGTSSERGKAIGNDELPIKSGCRIRALLETRSG